MIFKIFSAKNLAKMLALFASFCKDLIITLVFVKNANIFAENWQKSQKLVIITSTPARFNGQSLVTLGQISCGLRSIFTNSDFRVAPCIATLRDPIRTDPNCVSRNATRHGATRKSLLV
jgi:hypothetical protein